jgi:signal transduction histidine kinase/radical SAM superfamily enzyme YgiQ (UPF0313 family)
VRILLVNPAKVMAVHAKYVTFPNGLLYIAAVLEKNGHRVQIYDGNVDHRQPADFVSFKPEIIGFTVVTGPNIDDAIAQSIEFKKVLPGVKVVWGNAHPSILPEQTVVEPYIDYVVVGAGEYTLLELVQHLESGHTEIVDIKGLVHKKNGQVVKNEARPFIKYLDELPDPAWHLIDVKKYWAATLNTSRGCPFRCTFCYNSGFHNGYRGDFSAERIVSQVAKLKKHYGITHIRFFEDNFTFDAKRLRQFCKLIIDKKIKIKWDCEARADLAEEDIALIARAGCVSVGLGVETGSPRMLSFLKKGVDLKKMEKTFWTFVKYRIAPRLYIMEAVPTEKIEDFIMTHELLERLDNPPYLYMRFVPYPGTPLLKYCEEKGLVTPPQRLGDWADFTVRSATQVNLSDVPTDIVNGAMAEFVSTYAIRRLKFTIKHRRSYFWTMLRNPVEFFQASRDLVRCSLTYANGRSGGFRLAPIRVLISSGKAWLKQRQQHLEWTVEKRTAELMRANEQLRQQLSQHQQAAEIQRLYQQERKTRQGLEEQNKRQVEFTRALVHELKTPLTPVLAASDLLISESPPEPLLSLAKTIDRGVCNLSKRIDELLDLARGEIGMLRLHTKSFNPLRLLQEVADYVAPEAARNKQSLELELPPSLPPVCADEDRLREVVLNLLGNAFKFTPKAGKITLKACRVNGSLVVAVKDTGRGIVKEEQQRLFEPYYCPESERERLNGLGLGLALSKMLMELHGGQIWVESQRGKGSTFSFSLPVEAARKELLPADNGRRATSSQRESVILS